MKTRGNAGSEKSKKRKVVTLSIKLNSMSDGDRTVHFLTPLHITVDCHEVMGMDGVTRYQPISGSYCEVKQDFPQGPPKYD